MPNSNVSPQEAKQELAKRELARRYMRHYARYIYPNYQENWHTELICNALDLVVAGKIRFLMIEAPPRHSKSIHVSKLFPSFTMGKNADEDVIVSSYSGDLAVDHGRDTRNIVDSIEYQNLFDTRLAPDSKAKGKWNSNGRGAYNAVGVGGSATGKGAKYLIVDDPFKDRKEADSEIIRKDRFDWLRTVARTRLTPDGALIIMHTRWHEGDIIGKLTEGEDQEDWIDYFDFLKGKTAKWVRLTLRAIAEEEEPFRKKGDVLWPQRYPLTELMDIRRFLGSYEWSSLYQQRPIDDASREFHKQWFKYRKMEDVEKMVVRKFATIDSALTIKDTSDYTGVVRNYVNALNQFHLKATRYRINSKELIDLVFMLHAEGFEQIGIEEGAHKLAIKPFLEDEMKKRGKFPRVVPLKHENTQKETRIRGLIPWYENGQVFHIEGECVDLEEELLHFPKAVHDDVADAAAYQPQIAEPPQHQNRITQRPFETSMPLGTSIGPPSADSKPMRPPSQWAGSKKPFMQDGFDSSFPVEGEQ